jgi:hypothetical protein
MAGIMAVAALQLPADFTYRETTTITGGAMLSMMKVVGVFSKQAHEPVQSRRRLARKLAGSDKETG